ncbi:hypothetical protein F511_33327 [Dorcoceras hygrometricum]|uniref:Uncharacterized protein n=1 Tax=Dorcoceras hygrometricum TaxID=472368 RepID=A0A2Z7CNF7_9LAMI|nr:hypothetical protein F511_33327 [Dorcoceras hygrometricum]
MGLDEGSPTKVPSLKSNQPISSNQKTKLRHTNQLREYAALNQHSAQRTSSGTSSNTHPAWITYTNPVRSTVLRSAQTSPLFQLSQLATDSYQHKNNSPPPNQSVQPAHTITGLGSTSKLGSGLQCSDELRPLHCSSLGTQTLKPDSIPIDQLGASNISLGGRHSHPIVTAPTIALDFSDTTQQSASHNVAPNQQFTTSKKRHVHAQAAKSCSIRTFPPSNYLQTPPGSNHAAGHFLEAEIQKLTLAEERTHRLFSKASKSSSFAFPLPAKYYFSNGSSTRVWRRRDKIWLVQNISKCKSTLRYIPLQTSPADSLRSIEVFSRSLSAAILPFLFVKSAATTKQQSHENATKRHRSNLSKRCRSNHQQTTALAQAKQPRADNSSLYKAIYLLVARKHSKRRRIY